MSSAAGTYNRAVVFLDTLHLVLIISQVEAVRELFEPKNLRRQERSAARWWQLHLQHVSQFAAGFTGDCHIFQSAIRTDHVNYAQAKSTCEFSGWPQITDSAEQQDYRKTASLNYVRPFECDIHSINITGSCKTKKNIWAALYLTHWFLYGECWKLTIHSNNDRPDRKSAVYQQSWICPVPGSLFGGPYELFPPSKRCFVIMRTANSRDKYS